MSGIKVLAVYLIIVSLTLSGALIFIKGFLLSRTVVDAKSVCEIEFALRAEDHTHHGVEGCWMHGRFKRAIIVIIDALKYDFISFNTSLKPDNTPVFKNKLLSLHQLQVKKPLHTRQYKFMADPPTTTMQRLKGLTTGSLPTFVDAGANFHSYEIMEDNLIDQIISLDKKIKFLGDDTWLSLFPNRFYKSFEFPSFNVKDLHTVDNGILKHIYPEIRRSDWDVVIAHFLGVDHCGHRYGPNHPAMAEKLSQMDEVIRNITQLMRDDTILFIMGDHGMTKTGDHGGDSTDELEAGLFIYSPAQIASAPQTESEELEIAQTDFVPTLSLLLGSPIPFSNLGMVIPELFSHCPWWNTASNNIRQVYHKVKALRLNAHQINMYLSTYQQVASDLPRSELKSLQQMINKAETDVQSLVTAMIAEGATDDALRKFHELEEVYKLYIRSARKICENVWAKFDWKMIITGLLTIALGISQSVYFLLMWKDSDENLSVPAKFLLGGSLLHMLYLLIHTLIFSDAVPPLMAFTLALVLIFAAIVVVKQGAGVTVALLRQFLTLENAMSCTVIVLICCSYFSNSFVVYEDIISQFFLVTIVFVLTIKIFKHNLSVRRNETPKSDVGKHSRKPKAQFDLLQAVTQPSCVACFTALTVGILIRLTSGFLKCREEQHACEDSIFHLPLSAVQDGSKNQRYVFSVFCLVVMVFAVRHWLKYYGNMNGTSVGVVCMNYSPPFAALFTCLHWALQALPESSLESFSQWQQVFMAQLVYVICILSLMLIIASPLLIYMLPTKADSSLVLPHKADVKQIIPTLYNQLKVRLSEDSDNEKPPVVYGLGSVYSASVVALVSVLSLVLALLLSDGVAPGLLLATIACYLCMELYAASMASQEPDLVSEGPSWTGAVMLSLLSSVFFYATGHQATIPSIRFESAYTGFYGDFTTFILPGLLIWLNTFAGPIFFSLACPLLVFWPMLSSPLVGWMVKRTQGQLQKRETWQGDFKLFNNATKLRKSMFRVCCSMVLISSLKLFAAASAAALHRRHLMVWKIFAPRFVYEAALFLTTSICALLAFLFVLRVDSALSNFVKNLKPSKDR